MFAGNFKLKAQKYLPSGLGSPADGKRRIVALIVLCVGGVPKQSKMAIEAEIENNFVYYLNSKCCRVPLVVCEICKSAYIPFFCKNTGGGGGGKEGSLVELKREF